MAMPLPIASEETREEFEEKMTALALKEKERETENKAAALGLPYLNLQGFPISQEALALVPEETARALQALCFFYLAHEFRIGAVDPAAPGLKELINQLAERTRAHGVLYLISAHSFAVASALYARMPKYRSTAKGTVALTAQDLQKFSAEFRSFTELQEQLKGVNVTDLVTLLIAAALRAAASDLHIEAEESGIIVRLRLDGVLHKAAQLPKEDWPKIISRLKLLAGLKINISDRPQDGRFTIKAARDSTDVRVSIIPTAFGESVVMRLLRSSAVGLQFADLGLRGAAFEQLNREVERPNGMILVTGPTGSGKTTTLYAVLNKLNDPETKIITLEDPIEYKLPGIAQSQVDPSKDYSFASGLRAILRQDPDVVMVGEIRDKETVEIAIQAALTGHLMLSTVHTNSAAGAIPRLIALGAQPFLLAPALNVIVAQRLVRKIHAECKEEVRLDAETIGRVKKILSTLPKSSAALYVPLSGGPDAPEQSSVRGRQAPALQNLKFYRGRGCAQCFDLGYKGRTGIYEVMIMNKEIEEVILSGKVSEYVIQEIAARAGMITMAQDGLLKALEGITTVEEVFSVAE